MPKRSPRPRNLFGRFRNSTGLLMALAFALIGAGVVLFVFISQRSPGSGASGKSNPANVAKFGDLPQNIGEATDITAVGSTRDARFQVADKNDPSRVAIELLFSQMNPVGNAVYEAADPRAWIYMKDGRTVYIRADQARVKRVGAAAPESGEFRGNGLALVFPPRPPDQAGRAIDPDTDVPGMIGYFNAASFDTVLLELSSQDAFSVETETVRLSGTGFVVRANQVQERLEFARINSGGEIRYRVKSSSPSTPAPDAEPDREPTPALASSTVDLHGPPAPAADQPAEPSLADAQSPAPSDALAASDLIGPPAPVVATAPVALKQDLYLAEFRDGVKMVQTSRTLSADLLSVWLRFIDNKLPEDALGQTAAAEPPRRDPSRPATPGLPLAAHVAALTLSQTAPAAPTTTAAVPRRPVPRRALFSPSQTDVILTWTGGMVARPLSNDRPPAELADNNHIHARFTADRPGGDARVVLTDTQTGAAGIAAAVDYAATARLLSLSAGPGVEHVDFTVPESGRFIVPRVAINLATGRGRVTGGGMLVQLPGEDPNLITVRPQFPPLADPDAPLPEQLGRRITWSSFAEFKFRSRKGQMTDALESAAFTGDVVASDRDSWLSGGSLAANFRPTPHKTGALSRIRITGGALAYAPATRSPSPEFIGPLQQACVTADALDVRFEPGRFDPSDDEPTLAIASGAAVVRDPRGSIAADRLESTLVARPRAGGTSTTIEPGEVDARGNVVATLFNRPSEGSGDGPIIVRADRLKADAQQRIAELIADADGQVSLARGGSIISGPQMRLDENLGRLEVFGMGSLRHVQLDSTASEAGLVLSDEVLARGDESLLPPGVTLVRATWSRSMSYADQAGRIECHGDATVTSLTHEGGQVSRSERLLLDITPASEARKAEAAAAAGATGQGVIALAAVGGGEQLDGRRLLRAESLGAVLEREGGAPASVKSWKFAPRTADEPLPPAPREYEQILYLEGPRIMVDEVAGTMTIPAAGRGVTFDQSRRSPADGSPAQPTALAGGSSGRSQFTWAGSLEFNRFTGALRMQRDVELRHLPLDSSELIRMVCDTLDATFNTRGGRGAELLTADAVGGVFAESGTRHLTADQFTFDAATGAAMARSTSDSPVTMHDSKTASPLLARALRWETRTDRIEVTEPMPVTGGISR